MMGPDCGTAIIDGMPLAFANVVKRGPIGIVGAAGTGIQEISSCIDRLGGGVSQAIGTGGRDLSEGVGGTMMLLGIEALAADPATRVLVVVSKPPSEVVAEKGDRGGRAYGQADRGPLRRRRRSPGRRTCQRPLRRQPRVDRRSRVPARRDVAIAQRDRSRSHRGALTELLAHLDRRSKLRGLFCGGTTGNEALVLLGRAGLEVRSNLHKKGPLRIDGATVVSGHVLLDLGDDLFCVGRPHPMIEPGLRNERLQLEMADPEVGVLLFDVVLGHGSHA